MQLKKWKKQIGNLTADLALAAGAVLVSAGIGMIYRPAGVIAAGLLLIAGAVLAVLGRGETL